MFAGLVRDLLPPGVALAWEPISAEPGALYPDEEAVMVRAVAKRQREFALGRTCARRALADVGAAPCPLLPGASREPLWPAGFVGSITHDRALSLAVAARAERFLGLGVDVEPDEALTPAVAAHIWSPSEAADAAARAVVPLKSAAKLVFSAKEAVYKCQFALTGVYVGFFGVAVTLGAERFEAVLTAPAGELPAGFRFAGTWRRDAGELLTAVWVAR